MMPLHRVVAAVDFSDSSRSTVRAAAALARRTGADLQLLHAIEQDLANAAAAARVDIVSDARLELLRIAEQADAGSGTAPTTHVAVGCPTDVICDISCRENADLVVMGVRGQSADSAQCGSTAAGVVRHAVTSTMFVPDSRAAAIEHDAFDIGQVVVALDLTGPSLCAAAAAVPLAAALGAELEALHVVPPVRTASKWQTLADAAIAERLRRATDDVALRIHGVRGAAPFHWRATAGGVAEILADATRPKNGRWSLLVMGRRLPGHRDCDPGSLATSVLALAHGPVLLHIAAD
jgi:nucleotide-binding universal stress UspA family protein